MDLLNNLLQPNAPYKSIVIPGAEIDGAMSIAEEEIGEMIETETCESPENYNYARVYQEREVASYMEASRSMAKDSNSFVKASLREFCL